MSLSIIEINSSPYYQFLNTNIEDAKRSVCRLFCELVTYVSSVTNTEKCVVELIFHKYEENLPRLFLTFRSDEQQKSISEEQIISDVLSCLTSSYFKARRILGKEFIKTVAELRSHLSGKIVALTKSEKLITSNLSYSGYYYYTDILESSELKPTEINNYNTLINQLMSCKKMLVSFQLIPTQLTQEEYYALSNLSGELAITTRGLQAQNQMVKEIEVEMPRRTYAYYTERVSQPLFIGNIIAASDVDDLNGIVSILKSCIQQSVSDTISFTSIELENTHLLSYDFFHFPWNIYNQLLVNYRNQSIWNNSIFQPINLARLPFLYTATEASIFFKLPIDDGKVRGIRRNRVFNDNEVIDSKVFSENNIKFGKLPGLEDVIIGAKAADFTRHTLIVGTPGSGKTTFAINLLLQFYEKGIPFLAIEPTKTEYRALIDIIPDLQVFTPGNSGVVPFIINPFIPPKGIRLEQYVPSLMSAFKAAFSMESPLDVIFLRSIRQCYAQYGWKNSSTCEDIDVQPFGLFEFILVFKKIVSDSAYKAETKANIETGGTFRLMNLLDQNRYIYDNVNTIPIDVLLERSTIIELNAIADDEQKALVMALLLINICLYTKSKGSISGRINNILMIDEAHVLLDTHSGTHFEQNKAQGATVKSLQNMIAEIRSFGTGIIIADQVPSKVTKDVVADTDIKVSFRLVEKDERYIFSNSTNMTEQQSQHLAQLKRGEAIVYYSDLESPKMITTPDIRAERAIRYQVSDNEISNRVHFWDLWRELLVPFFECRFCPQCALHRQCNFEIREKAEYYAMYINSAIGTNVKNKEMLVKYMYRLHELIIKYEVGKKSSDSLKTVCNCAKIHFLREILLSGSFILNRGEIEDLLRRTLINEVKSDV